MMKTFIYKYVYNIQCTLNNNTTVFADADECYLYAFNCLQYAFYAECIKWCDQMISKVKDVPHTHSLVRLIRGKAYAHMHQRQMWNVFKNRMLDVLIAGNFVDRCASNAKKAIGDLGFALDQGVLDENGSYLLDIVMIDYVMIKRQLKDCQRCLLCRRRGVKLLHSHTIPMFMFKKLMNEYSKRLKEQGIELDELGIIPSVGKFKFHSPKAALKCDLLCGKCEQRLSQNGEDQFQKEFIPHIYSTSDEIQEVRYDSNAYSFCLGVLFRSFVNNTFFQFSNADEIYLLLVACRQHLIKLPAKFVEKEIPYPPSIDGVRQMSLPDAYLVINPSVLHVPHSSVLFLSGCMAFGVCTWFLITPLSVPLNRKPKVGATCHGLVVHMGVCNIVVPFSPARKAPLDDCYRIHPQGGVYPILPEIKRWNATPSGIYQAIVYSSIISMRQYQQLLSGMKTTQGDSQKADSVARANERICNSLSLEQGPFDMSSLESMQVTPEEAKLVSSYYLSNDNKLIQVEILPEDFTVTVVKTPPKLILRKGYTLLYHIYDHDTNTTYFLTANSSDILNGKLVVIMTVAENYQRVEGVHVHIKSDGSVCVTGYIQEPTTETLKQSQYVNLMTVTERVIQAINVLLRKCGSPRTFLLYASIHTRLGLNIATTCA